MSSHEVVSLLLGASDRVGVGRLVGGWEYVWASYGITWAVMALYALRLWIRRPKASLPGEKS